ncbi:nucleotidyltransferase domain-containing protein [Nocardioides sp. KIGAM211]|uniref:Nucleotidyltransferase domain-containing protein n=1 Tax=Nocardioides luti TaxID=2761101 RepID=A0A7X0RH90_9ACTN|nr:nucleotidyltransferase domain-containing protein [Nocardioides luti]MBB6628293.1 nucleotidyltransferase domain-containing protein [Nocardioides luti]
MEAETTARRLVAEQFPEARAAWLGGSVVLGGATPTSDLDVTVVLGEAVVHRESLTYSGWPVELFVHTEDSVRHFVAKDLARRRPTMARLVGEGVVLVDADGLGASLAQECRAVLAAGPAATTPAALDLQRYALTDLLDDLAGGADPAVLGATAVATWQAVAELRLATGGRWSGSGKWLARELAAYDLDAGTAYAVRLHEALVAAVSGATAGLVALADEVLAPVGGRLWSGFRADAVLG